MGFFPKLLRVTKFAVQFTCFAHAFNQYVAEVTWCVGPSMLPNFSMSGVVAVEHVSHHFRELEIGDVVVCISPAKPGRSVLKRVIGMPGDNICEDPTLEERKYISVPKGHVWVGGDNLSNSTDSRSYGPVAMGLIKGRVFAKVWPEVEILRNNLVPV
ncbi:peptidase S24/S26A/S26B/S26C [Mucor mucedo]|uniref:peptidase S24/S26A/S26B/S26C n=1 Tax=Mucor mucedo TaxID=29922 RepID=UPI002220EDC6|nr:peptidase S24/S26A/S26B/S26C [Mucor mucedo]KAI7889022.1 peptidase S24/S26A/S26B/S26C [Mucor mucedo]